MISLANYITGLIGCWIFSDGAYSIALYLGAPSFRGDKQSWSKDHAIRVIRCILGIVLIVIGARWI